VNFSASNVIRGVARTYTADDSTQKQELFERGEIVCFQAASGRMTRPVRSKSGRAGRILGRASARFQRHTVVYLSSHWLG